MLSVLVLDDPLATEWWNCEEIINVYNVVPEPTPKDAGGTGRETYYANHGPPSHVCGMLRDYLYFMTLSLLRDFPRDAEGEPP